MNTHLTFRKALSADLERVMVIIGQAQSQMAASGSDQWQNGYPAADDILGDCVRGYGHVLCDGDCVVAYGAVVFDGEAAYETIEGEWSTFGDYVVVHRLAVADEVKRRGVARRFMHCVEHLARERGVATFRIDTNFDNTGMLSLLQGEGFCYCGKIRYPSGERLAFDKKL